MGGLKPQLAVIKETKSNVDASWNHLGNKFCVGASSGNVFIGRFEPLSGFWVAGSISGKKPLHSQTVVGVRFDPLSGRVVASASADGKCYITTCFVEETDTAGSGPFAGVTSYGETLLSFNSVGWVNSVSFSPDATTIAFFSHDCEINFADVSGAAAGGAKSKAEKVLYKGNPFLCGYFVNATTYVACGFDKVPLLFKKSGSSWQFVRHLDEGIAKEKQAVIAKGSFEQSQVFFKKSETEKATALKLDDDVVMREMNTKHANYINCLKVYPGGKLCTSDVNGYINLWETAGL